MIPLHILILIYPEPETAPLTHLHIDFLRRKTGPFFPSIHCIADHLISKINASIQTLECCNSWLRGSGMCYGWYPRSGYNRVLGRKGDRAGRGQRQAHEAAGGAAPGEGLQGKGRMERWAWTAGHSLCLLWLTESAFLQGHSDTPDPITHWCFRGKGGIFQPEVRQSSPGRRGSWQHLCLCSCTTHTWGCPPSPHPRQHPNVIPGTATAPWLQTRAFTSPPPLKCLEE